MKVEGYMGELKRYSLKYVRDYIKSDYKLKSSCYICGTTKNLELHHLYSLSQLFWEWCQSKHIKTVTSVEQIKSLRVIFKKERWEELSNIHLLTLCRWHHQRLHNLFGQRYQNHLVPRVRNWLEVQREKYDNI